MKKLFVALNAVLVSVVVFAMLGSSSLINAQNPKKLILSPVDQLQADREIADIVRQKTNRTSEGLIEQYNADGSVLVDLQGRFQNLILSKINIYGDPTAGCIANLSEANAFYGKNLETGQILPQGLMSIDSVRKTAQSHGMSKQEYLFYKNLIEKAKAERLLNPNAATITIVNDDGPGEGFNDNTAATPVGGNNGTTLGQQRLNLFNFAADIWGAFLDSNVTIQVLSDFDALPCNSTSAVLGGASALAVTRDYTNAGLPGTWHHIALANKQRGIDLSANPDIGATFNSQLNGNPGCLGGTRFYLGFDNTTPANTINLLITLLHEMGHGLGFSNFSDEATGALFIGLPDVFTTFMFDQTTSKFWNAMNNAERQASAINNNNVFWDGANIKIGSGFLTSGRNTANGRVELYVPNPLEQGSSVSHFNIRVFPNVLMEPNITLNLPLTLDLTRQQMRDVGWYRDTTADVIPDTITNVTPSGGAVLIGSQTAINWANNGGFNKNVTVELSIDGGTTYPTTLATDIANTGTFTFTVPNTPTSLAKVRVREHNFVAPLGVSSNTFTIGNVIPPTNTPVFDFDGDGKTDVSIFRGGPTPAQWWYLRSSDGGNRAFSFGLGTDKPVPADYTGDGKTDLAFFRPSSSQWFILRSEDSTFFAFPFGASGDIPAPGDFDGDGKADAAVFRPSTGTWFINNSSGGTTITSFGIAEDKPTIADFDGDGKDDIAIFRPSLSQWWQLRSTAGVIAYSFGTAGDKTVQGDYTGDGKADVALFRPSSGEWFILRSENGTFFSFPFGTNGDVPSPGDYDGDGKFDAAVFRPTTTTWFLQGSTSGTQILSFGLSSDIALPNVYSVP